MKPFIYGDIRVSEFNQKIAQLLDPNKPQLLGVSPFQSYKWVLAVLAELGITLPEDIDSAWALFTKINDVSMRYINKDVFSLGIQSSFDNALLSKEIKSGSIVFGYFPGHPYVFRSIDKMITNAISPVKIFQLNRFLKRDDKVNLNTSESDFGFFDTTPMNKMVFSEKGYKEKWEDVDNKILINKKLPFAPINHVGIYYNGHFFNLTSTLTVEAPEAFRAVAFYNFKNGFLKVRELLGDIRDAVNTANDIANEIKNDVRVVNNEFNRLGNFTGIEDVNKVVKDINF
jgi:hypothetical protein